MTTQNTTNTTAGQVLEQLDTSLEMLEAELKRKESNFPKIDFLYRKMAILESYIQQFSFTLILTNKDNTVWIRSTVKAVMFTQQIAVQSAGTCTVSIEKKHRNFVNY